ncbi:EAL domain-containing protein [Streptomyces sp. L7]
MPLLAEHTGLIVPLGRWVLDQSVRQAKQWQERHGGNDATGPLRINVNLSPCQLSHPGLVQDTVDILERAGVSPDALCLGGQQSPRSSAPTTTCSGRCGASPRWASTSPSTTSAPAIPTCANLRRLPVSILKLDRSFTQGMQQFPADPVDLKIVEGIVSLAHSLNLAATVEGVETGAQAEQLRIPAATRPRAGTTPAPARRSGCTTWRWWTRRADRARTCRKGNRAQGAMRGGLDHDAARIAAQRHDEPGMFAAPRACVDTPGTCAARRIRSPGGPLRRSIVITRPLVVLSFSGVKVTNRPPVMPASARGGG